MEITSVCRRGAVALALCAAFAGAAVAQTAPTVKVKGNIAPPEIKGAIVLQIDVFRVDRDEFGRYKEPSWRDSRTAPYDPAFPNRPATFEFDLEPRQEYQMLIDLLDKDGNRLRTGTYTFSGPSMVDVTSEKRVTLRPGATEAVQLPLTWGTKDAKKANFLILVEGDAGDYQLILSFNDNAVPEQSL